MLLPMDIMKYMPAPQKAVKVVGSTVPAAPIPLDLLMDADKHLYPEQRARMINALGKQGVSSSDIKYILGDKAGNGVSSREKYDAPYWTDYDGSIIVSPKIYEMTRQMVKAGSYKDLGIYSDEDLDSFYEGAGYIKINPSEQWKYVSYDD